MLRDDDLTGDDLTGERVAVDRRTDDEEGRRTELLLRRAELLLAELRLGELLLDDLTAEAREDREDRLRPIERLDLEDDRELLRAERPEELRADRERLERRAASAVCVGNWLMTSAKPATTIETIRRLFMMEPLFFSRVPI